MSWLTILKKRENFRAAFDGFDFRRSRAYTEADVERLLADAGIVRHQGKIRSTINNAARARGLSKKPARSPPSSGATNRPPKSARRATPKRR